MDDVKVPTTASEAKQLASEDNIRESDLPKPTPDTQEVENSDNRSVASATSADSNYSDLDSFAEYLLKITQLLKDINLAQFEIEKIQHGPSFQNCVYALSHPYDVSQQYILRVPVCSPFWDGDEKYAAIENDAALLEYLADKLPVPRLKAFCATNDNTLGTPYTVQTQLPGNSLNEIYGGLDQSEKFEIMDQFVELLVKVEAIRFPTAGTFTAPPASMVNGPYAAGEPTITIFNEGDEEFVKEPRCVQDRAGPDIKTLLRSHIDGLILKEQKADSPELTVPPLEFLSVMVDELDHEGGFKGQPYPIVLHHWDLEPRNLMVARIGGQWKITGVIDWDDTVAIPRPLARKPPSWIWDFDFEEFTGYLDTDHNPNWDLSDEQKVLKARFDAKAAAALEGYLEDAYEHGRWLRRVWTFVRGGLHNVWYLEIVKNLEEDWSARPKTMAIPRWTPTILVQKLLGWVSHLNPAMRL